MLLINHYLSLIIIRLGYTECGPITRTTRSTYEKKFLQLLQAGGAVVGPPAASSNTPSKPNAPSAASASYNGGTQTPTRPANGSSSTPSKPRAPQPPEAPNTAHLESLEETASEDDQPAPSRTATVRRTLEQRTGSNEHAFRTPAPVAATPAFSDHLEQPSESDTDHEDYSSPRMCFTSL